MNTIATGDRVTYRKRTGTVLATGGCGWTGCRNGDECVTIWFDDGITSENLRASELEPA